MKIVIVIEDLPSGLHRASCPALPGCMAIGQSRQETLERMDAAIAGYLASFDSVMPENLDLEVCGYCGDLRRAPQPTGRSVVPNT